MSQQQRFNVTTEIDVRRFVKFYPDPQPSSVRVSGYGGRRSGEIGTTLGTLGFQHSSGYEVLVEFPDGKIESFTAMSLFPAEDAA